MNKKNYLILGVGIVILTQTLVFALIPPPPANQLLGVYDTNFANYSEGKCRNCHTSGGTVYDPAKVNKSTNGVPDRHHMLVVTGKYGCQDCHPVVNGNQITMVRDCMQCHGITFNNISIRIPHHETQDAQNRHCSYCHGNLVDDYDDSHYIPPYNISEVTPDTKYKIINASTGKKWGGCESCHEQDMSVTPMIYFNNKSHHRLGSLSGFNPPNNTKCITCHDLHGSQLGSDSVRYCERCHAVKSLHNIQYDYINTSNSLGSGHIGANWDCNGCHAWYVTGGVAPGADIIIPSIESISTSKIYEGSSVALTISGKDFVTTMDSKTYSSVIVITNGINPITITPSSITASTMIVTVPSLSKGGYGIYALKNGTVKSNKMSLTVVPKVIVSLAKKSSNNLKITGTGFGPFDPKYISMVNVTINKGGIFRSANITSWSDSSISIVSKDTVTGDVATVNSIYGANSTIVTGK